MEAGLRQYRSCWDLSRCGSFEEGAYVSQWFRGLETGMEWLRLKLEGADGMRVRIYVSEDEPEKFSGPGSRVPVMDRTECDLLLYGVRGKYLCFTVEPGAKLRSFQLEFPGHSIDEGLPTVLRQDETLRALLGVYQSRFMDLNRMAAGFPARLDPESPEALPQLDRWLGASRWTGDAELNRKLLPRACELARLRGTGKGLSILAELVTGCPCRIAEKWKRKQWEALRHRRADPGFGEKEDVLLLVPPQVSREKLEQLRSLLPDFMPLGVTYRVVYLAEGIAMDGHSYLDENAALRGDPVCIMDGREQETVLLE